MADNSADVSDLKSRLPPSVPETLIRSTLAKFRGDKQKCYDHLNNSSWRHSLLDAHVASSEHVPLQMRRMNTYGPDSVSHEQYQGTSRRLEKSIPTESTYTRVEAQRKQLEELQEHCDALMKQLSWAKSESDNKKESLTDLRYRKIPTAQELQDEKDLIKTLESDLESHRNYSPARWQCAVCSFKNSIQRTSCEKCSWSREALRPNIR